MGRRISFYTNQNELTYQQLISESYELFRIWYLIENEESLKLDNEHLHSEAFATLIEKTEQFYSFRTQDQIHVDILCNEFIGFFDCDADEEHLTDLVGLSVSTWKYLKSTKIVNEYLDKKSQHIWNFIISGRSIFNNLPFNPTDYDSKMAFWTSDELEHISENIISEFGDIESLRDRFWSDVENEKLKLALKEMQEQNRDYYSLSDHSPISGGLEYILSLYDEIKTYKGDIILEIELIKIVLQM